MDYILACVDGLSWPQLAPFVRSARTCAPQARLVLFVHSLNETTRAALSQHGVELQAFDAIFPGGLPRRERIRKCLWWLVRRANRALRYSEFKRRAICRAGGLLLPRNQGRFFAYRAFLEGCLAAGDSALFCDARDLIFQRDPFPLIDVASLVLTQEKADAPLRANRFNAQWLTETYGRAALDRLGEMTIVCAGVIGGGRDPLLSLIDRIIAESLAHPILYGADQAILNHLHGTGGLATATVMPNRGALAWHLYGMTDAEIVVNDPGQLVDAAGYVYPIVHMYDRFPRLEAAVLKRWGVTL